MTQPGKRNLITDVAGISVGHAEEAAARTGVTVVLAERPFAAAVDVRGGAPGTSETETLDPANLVGAVDAIALSGGSVYGLEAAAGVIAWMGARGRGFQLRPDAPPAPIVPGAILFDLANGGNKGWGLYPPYRKLGIAAAESAGEVFTLGNAGAGLGATAGMYKGGTGSASIIMESGFTLGALAVVNSAGSPVIPHTDVFWAFPFEHDGEFGGRRLPADFGSASADLPPDMKRPPQAGTNTTLVVIATDAALSRLELKRLAIMAGDGVARAIRPVHTPFDGDIVFALSTGVRELAVPRPFGIIELGNAAADCVARAIARAIHEATTLGNMRSYRDHCAKGENSQ
jgi:L-aminopeptidase/D-esterase-like protein